MQPDDNTPTTDDALEEARRSDDVVAQPTPLDQGDGRPAEPAANPFVPPMADDHPATDSNIDPAEVHDEAEENHRQQDF